jgi:hypothetical protein
VYGLLPRVSSVEEFEGADEIRGGAGEESTLRGPSSESMKVSPSSTGLWVAEKVRISDTAGGALSGGRIFVDREHVE